jgi:hypothetical protein
MRSRHARTGYGKFFQVLFVSQDYQLTNYRNFTIVMATPIMVSNIRWGTYLFFAAVNFAFFFPI